MKSKLVTLLLLLCAAGYLSNSLSREECQQQVAVWISKKLLAGNEFFVPPDRIEPSMTVFKAIGARVQNPPLAKGSCPWAEVGDAKSWIPFVISVSWGYEQLPLNGQGGVRWFFCFFGYPATIVDEFSWIS
jgi:hypothetical protein